MIEQGTTHLRIQAVHGKTFRRFGREYTDEPTTVPIEDFAQDAAPPPGHPADWKLREILGSHLKGVLRIEQLEIDPEAAARAKAKADAKAKAKAQAKAAAKAKANTKDKGK